MKSFNNARVLTNDEYKFYKDKYSFIVFDNKVAVKIKDYNRITLHDVNETFSINAKPYRKLSFRPESMKIWIELECKYNLIDVQQAVSKLYITFQKVNKDNVISILNGNDIKIKVEEIK